MKKIFKYLVVSMFLLSSCGLKKNENYKILHSYYEQTMIEEGETPLSYEDWIKENNIDETKEFEIRTYDGEIEWKYTTEDSSAWRTLFPEQLCKHIWNDGIIKKEPTCVEAGRIEYTCSKCKKRRNVDVPVDIHAHHYEEGICINCGGEEVLINDLLVSNKSTVASYSVDIKGYLDDETPNVRNHNYSDYQSSKKAYNPAVINWIVRDSPRTGFRVQYSLDENFNDYLEVSVDKDARSAELYNLLLGKKYYIKVLGDYNDGTHYGLSTITSSNIGPRIMHIDGVENVRDIGGYDTPYGRTLEGMIIRGGSLTNTEGSENEKKFAITEEGKIQMKDHLKIKTEFELRSGYTRTVLYNTNLQSYPIKSYADAIDDIANKEPTWKNLFKALAKKDNYPCYVHCTAGADRTGTLCYLIKILLGVSDIDCIHDHELTSFSPYGIRDRDYGGSSTDKENKFTLNALIEEINLKSTGSTMMEKVENLILWLGVTKDEIASIRAINLGKTVDEVKQLYA